MMDEYHLIEWLPNRKYIILKIRTIFSFTISGIHLKSTNIEFRFDSVPGNCKVLLFVSLFDDAFQRFSPLNRRIMSCKLAAIKKYSCFKRNSRP